MRNILKIVRGFVVTLMLAIMVMVSGCSSVEVGDGKLGFGLVQGRLVNRFTLDLERTSQLAEKYGRTDVKTCSDFLLASLKDEDSAAAKLKSLMAEDTAGLASAALKAALIAEVARSLNDPSQRAAFEKNFNTNCQAVAGSIFMNVLRDARTVGSRGAM